MRVLLLLRGAPGCGKSTWIEQNGLKPYALSADDIRMMYSSIEFSETGREQISQNRDNEVWDTLFHILKSRMERGEFTVIDATNSKTSEMNRYYDLCTEYRYRIYCVDFTDLPIEEAKRRNALRPEYKVVPDTAIDKMYSRFATQKIPGKITRILPDELDKIWYHKHNLCGYKKIHFIGDIHGCYTCMKSYFDTNGGIKDDEYYIFVGDYIDRGIENAEVVKFLLSIYEKSNVLLLEGNHERRLWEWANDVVTDSMEFETQTAHDLRINEVSKTDVRRLYRRLCQCAYFEYGEHTYFVSHGGISMIPENFTLVPTSCMIRGTGVYKDAKTVDDTFERIMGDPYIQIHGHRNPSSEPVRVNNHAYNLENGIEHGGFLRCMQVDENGTIFTHEIKNNVFSDRFAAKEDAGENKTELDADVGRAVVEMRKSNLIKESYFGNVSSFNFTKRAFYDKEWNDQTIRARGLFINIPKTKVVARSYNKFFNVNEVPETKLDRLLKTLSFPVRAYVKENGFLGIVSYNEDDDSLFITTKSSPNGPMSDLLRDMFYKIVPEDSVAKIKEFTKTQDVSMVFECIDIENDPHIIEYSENKLVLLDIIKNSMKFEKYPYDDIIGYAEAFGLEHKKLAYVIEDSGEFFDWYYRVLEEDYDYNGQKIEGFVIEDERGYMVKLKLAYYNFWKFMRGLSYEILRKGSIDGRKTSSLTTPLANYYYSWILTQYNPDTRLEEYPDICTLRRRFFESDVGKQFS